MDNETIGSKLQQLRGELSQKNLAALMREQGHRWSQTTVWLVETGERPLRLTEAKVVADLFGVTVSALLGSEPTSLDAALAEVAALKRQISAARDALA